MPGELQPLSQNFQIVDANGFPTQYFIKWAQQRQIDISEGITAAQAQELIDTWAASRDLIAGNGLTGGGDLSADRTFNVGPGTGIGVGANDVHLLDTAVAPGIYGDATHVGQFTVDQQGRIVLAANVPVAGGSGVATKETFAAPGANSGTTGSRGGIVTPLYATTVKSLYFQFAVEATASYIGSIVTLDASNNILTIVSQVTLSGLAVNINLLVYQFTFPSPVALTANVKYGFLLTRTVISGSAAFNMSGTTGAGLMPNLGFATVNTFIRGTFNTLAVGQAFGSGGNSYWWAAEIPL